MIAVYHQPKTPVGFWYKWGLDPKFLIQLSITLPVKLTRTHSACLISLVLGTLSDLKNTTNFIA